MLKKTGDGARTGGTGGRWLWLNQKIVVMDTDGEIRAVGPKHMVVVKYFGHGDTEKTCMQNEW
jgi:hypothetical protein